MITQLRTWLLGYADLCEALHSHSHTVLAAEIREFVETELSEDRCNDLAAQLQFMLAQLPVTA